MTVVPDTFLALPERHAGIRSSRRHLGVRRGQDAIAARRAGAAPQLPRHAAADRGADSEQRMGISWLSCRTRAGHGSGRRRGGAR